jgi:phosphate transport system permease protein
MRVSPKITQVLAVTVLGAATALTLVVLAFIIVVVLAKGLPGVNVEFLCAMPKDMGRTGGILPTIAGTLLLPLLAIAIALPLGVGTAVYLAEYTRETRLTRTLRFGTDCLAGIPSIIFGLFGFIFFVVGLRMGWCLLSGGLTLAIMVLPTIIRTSEEAIRAVPNAYREVSFSLGATRWETVMKVVLPNALPGIVTGVMLGIGRSIGETAAVIFTAGSAGMRLPTSVFDPVRTMSVHFYILAREGISNEKAYATAAVLIVSILTVNLAAYGIMHRFIAKRAK